jgi:hypothetical protein
VNEAASNDGDDIKVTSASTIYLHVDQRAERWHIGKEQKKQGQCG